MQFEPKNFLTLLEIHQFMGTVGAREGERGMGWEISEENRKSPDC